MAHGLGLFMISAAAGYWVLVQASGQRNQMKKLGQYLGLIIIAISLAGAACKIYHLATGKSLIRSLCPPGMGCPFMNKQAAAPTK